MTNKAIEKPKILNDEELSKRGMRITIVSDGVDSITHYPLVGIDRDRAIAQAQRDDTHKKDLEQFKEIWERRLAQIVRIRENGITYIPIEGVWTQVIIKDVDELPLLPTGDMLEASNDQ